MIEKCMKKSQGHLSSGTLNYFLVKYRKFARLYLLSKNHARLHDVTSIPVILNSNFYAENTSYFWDYHLQPVVEKVKSYLKATNHLLNKMKKI